VRSRMTAGLVTSYAKDDLGSKRREQMSVDCWRDQDLDDSRRPRLHRVNQRASLSAVVSARRMVGPVSGRQGRSRTLSREQAQARQPTHARAHVQSTALGRGTSQKGIRSHRGR
jgi:hypothetical protein